MRWQEEIRDTAIYSAIALATYFFIQSVIVIIHEHIHSTTAYLMGHMQDPLAIVWGNPLTLDGWDEGVSYSALFSAGLGTDSAIIAVMPLIFHAVIVTCGLYLLLSPALVKRKWGFHLIFWLVVMNLMELIAYMPMRAFATNGDIGNINHGLGLSAWVLFFPGTLLILIWLYLLFGRVLPRANVIIAGDSRSVRYALLCLSAFFVFDWRSIFRVVLLPFPETGWVIGFAGIFACVLVIVLCRPGLPWVAQAEERVNAEIGG
ncbi:MAG: hypothetical protein M0Q91_18280 [Methanoregula sp.]|jgi:hypothetical protein|nr:hypothetical protein [Methanoregula sp.]